MIPVQSPDKMRFLNVNIAKTFLNILYYLNTILFVSLLRPSTLLRKEIWVLRSIISI